MDSDKVLSFWFEELSPADWFKKSDSIDETIVEKFSSYIDAASKGELFKWRSSSLGRLAEILVLDQFSRNAFRNSPQAFANDSMALILAQEMVQWNLDQELNLQARSFVYMPYMHSESLLIQEEGLKLFNTPGLEDNYRFASAHKEVIERFGRFPHRNKILGRASTPEEEDHLKKHSGW